MREFINADCMQYMPKYPDDYFDLAIVDPPYGAGFTEGGGCKGWFTKYHQSFANETRFGSRFIWGGNYFDLPPTRCFLVWRKLTISENFTMAMAEYAWASFNDNAKVFEHAPQDKERFHPTQKPVALYKWILSRYAKQGDLILDTHVGSASSLIACEEMGFNYVGFEIDETYYKLAKQRIDEFNQQMRMEL